MAKTIDVSGKKFGKLTALRVDGSDRFGRKIWLCACDCGGSSRVMIGNLTSGNTSSCGCGKHPERRFSIFGQRFGRLVATKVLYTSGGKITWLCQCDCGNVVPVIYGSLSSGHTKSCGCLASECASARMTVFGKIRKGALHPRWNHLISDEERDSRRSDDDKKWSFTVLQRNRFRCVVCGNGGRLNAHHLKSYSAHRSDRLRQSNGVCLCYGCHKHFHDSFGYTGFSRDDFFTAFKMDDPGDDDQYSGVLLPVDGDAGNVVKYVARYKHKNSVEDLRKAAWYLNRLIEMESKGGAE